jgi:hypothetical protein
MRFCDGLTKTDAAHQGCGAEGRDSMKVTTAVEAWLSLEQVSQVLGAPWFIVWRWARDGDARLPAYRYWLPATPDRGSFRFRQQDVTALQTPQTEPTSSKEKQQRAWQP